MARPQRGDHPPPLPEGGARTLDSIVSTPGNTGTYTLTVTSTVDCRKGMQKTTGSVNEFALYYDHNCHRYCKSETIVALASSC